MPYPLHAGLIHGCHMQAEKDITAPGSLLLLTTQLREQAKVLLDASAALRQRAQGWKADAKANLSRVEDATRKLLTLVGPPIGCPKCGQPLAYLPQHLGKRVRCTPCGHKFLLTHAPIEPEPIVPPTLNKKKRGNRLLLAAAVVVVLMGGALVAATAFDPFSSPRGQAWLKAGGYRYDYSTPAKDDVETNRTVTEDLLDLSFMDTEGNAVKLADYKGQKNLVLVVMRGYSGQLCLNCLAQTSRLINNYSEFKKRDAEVVIAFPGQKEHLSLFLDRSSKENDAKTCPFPVLLDEGAKMVDRLGIRADLASPSTYILDRDGKVRFAYVGATITDRPSVKAMLTHLDRIASPAPK